MTSQKFLKTGITCAVALVLAAQAVRTAYAAETREPFIPRLVNSSTIPENGDVNPYGVAFVPDRFPPGGSISPGDVLVSNFNSSSNLQGTGTTIVQMRPDQALAPPGSATTFFASSLPGLSTALGVLEGGFVLVGNVPTTDGTFGTIGQGSLQVIDRYGHLLHTWTDATYLDGPWDLTLDDHGATAHVFVSSVLNGTVSRLDLEVTSGAVVVTGKVTIASGYSHVPNAAAVVLGPTGLAFDAATDVLYVASTADNAVYAVGKARERTSTAGRGSLVFDDPHLRGPLALRIAPDGNLLTANGDAVRPDVLQPSEIVEFTREGRFVREFNVDSSQGGAFGLDTLVSGPQRFNFAVVDDVTNTLSVYALGDRRP
jgi:DNA-binding beta-propeller fold protein YncE